MMRPCSPLRRPGNYGATGCVFRRLAPAGVLPPVLERSESKGLSCANDATRKTAWIPACARPRSAFIVGGQARRTRIDNNSRAPQMVLDDAICFAVPDHVIRHVRVQAVDEPGDYRASAVQFRNGPQIVRVQPTLHEHAVYLLADPTVESVCEVFDYASGRQHYSFQFAEFVVRPLGAILCESAITRRRSCEPVRERLLKPKQGPP
jgi:hypothetical protein